MRIQIAPWDVRSDVVLMNDAPSLMSRGMRWLHGGMNFVWVYRRLPAFIPMSLEYIVILDVGGVLPTYSQMMEEANKTVGTFDLLLNRFRETCGIEINSA